jgi:cytochrome c553
VTSVARRGLLAACFALAIEAGSTSPGGMVSAHAVSARLPERLADTGLYEPGHPDVVAARNRPFAPQYPLWSDGAAKTRWVYLPEGRTIDGRDSTAWDFPVGTRFWKEFRIDGRKIETRFLWKVGPAQWMAASYAWNAQGTEATLAPDAGIPGVAQIAPGRQHAIPSRADCAACHGSEPTAPLGFTALQLSTDRDPNAIHGEPLTPGMVTLRTLVEEKRLSPAHPDAVANPPRIATSNPRTRAALGYLLANCGGCHNGRGEISALGPILAPRDLMRDADEVARAMVGQPTKWQVPGTPDGQSVLIDRAASSTSAILVRMRSRRPSTQMPPLGTALQDRSATDALARWIDHDLSGAD